MAVAEILLVNIAFDPEQFTVGIHVKHYSTDPTAIVYQVATSSTGDPGTAVKLVQDALFAWSNHGRMGLACLAGDSARWTDSHLETREVEVEKEDRPL